MRVRPVGGRSSARGWGAGAGEAYGRIPPPQRTRARMRTCTRACAQHPPCPHLLLRLGPLDPGGQAVHPPALRVLQPQLDAAAVRNRGLAIDCKAGGGRGVCVWWWWRGGGGDGGGGGAGGARRGCVRVYVCACRLVVGVCGPSRCRGEGGTRHLTVRQRHAPHAVLVALHPHVLPVAEVADERRGLRRGRPLAVHNGAALGGRARRRRRGLRGGGRGRAGRGRRGRRGERGRAADCVCL